MATPSEPRFLVLHGLRLKGLASADDVGAACGLGESAMTQMLAHLEAEGLVTRREGRLAGWSLTPSGRERHAELLVADVSTGGCRERVDGCYGRFLQVNDELLRVCTDWQLRTVGGEQVPNDHADAVHDKEVIGRLRGVDDAIQPVCADLADAMGRFAGYGPRLRGALEKVEGGAPEWFTRPMMDSYHTVWFELHEDLLTTLGIERSKETG